jgi:hypothetical protein
MYGTNGISIHNFHATVIEWMSTHKHSAVLISLVGHSTVTTGEIVYALPGATENKYASVDKARLTCLHVYGERLTCY